LFDLSALYENVFPGNNRANDRCGASDDLTFYRNWFQFVHFATSTATFSAALPARDRKKFFLFQARFAFLHSVYAFAIALQTGHSTQFLSALNAAQLTQTPTAFLSA
jgi:hypothetical protein